MKLFVPRTFVFGLFLATWIFNGCSTPPPMAASPDIQKQSNAEVARFHVGETVSVNFSGTPDQILPHEEIIKEDGSITLSLIGPVRAVGKTAGELQNEIHDLYVPKYFVRLTVTVKASDLIYYVRGEVKGSGRQLYVGEITVTKAIASAGDFTDFANHGNVLLIRANGQRIKVDCDAAQRDSSKDPHVYPGDQIVVARKLW
ncbi:MAG: polysaccharide biosynthesis/export family protein [Verrucomicrobiales bacterium]|nr:polysaccharide biosynthesis/export family protein [Verrucomicrobiales bacterium]